MITATFENNLWSVDPAYQWDLNQVLTINGLSLTSVEVHFAHHYATFAIVRQAEIDSAGTIRVSVPNVLLRKAHRLNAFVCVRNGDKFNSLYKIVIPIISRQRPSDYAGEDERDYYSLDALDVETEIIGADDDATVEKVLDGDRWILRFSIPRGDKGERGTNGTSVTHSWNGTVLSVTSASGTSSANLKGETGKDGYTPVKGVDYRDGADGYTPQKGIDYFDGKDGKDGIDGKNGYTPVKGVDYFDGKNGKDGANGNDGYTPQKGIDYFDGKDGKDGYTPIKGVDYFDGKDGSDADVTGENIKNALGYTPANETKVSELSEAIAEQAANLGKAEMRISQNEARIDRLERIVTSERLYIDDTIAYRKIVPADVRSYAEISKIGGMTQKANVGTEESPVYELHSAPVTEIESTGANIIPFPYRDGGAGSKRESNGITWTVNADGSITVNGTATATSYFRLLVNPLYNVNVFLSGAISSDCYIRANNDGVRITDDTGGGAQVNASKIDTINIMVKSGASFSNVTIYPMLNCGSTALPYTPYQCNTVPIPEVVQALDGYGWGINADYHNYIDWENRTLVKTVDYVDLGTMDWKIATTSDTVDYFFLSDSKLDNLLRSGWKDSIINRDYQFFNTRSVLVDKGISMYNSTSDHRICVADSDYTDAASFKAAMSGVILVYELAEPIITDISDIMLDDNYITVQSGGAITMVNEHGYAVPSEITYVLKGAE